MSISYKPRLTKIPLEYLKVTKGRDSHEMYDVEVEFLADPILLGDMAAVAYRNVKAEEAHPLVVADMRETLIIDDPVLEEKKKDLGDIILDYVASEEEPKIPFPRGYDYTCNHETIPLELNKKEHLAWFTYGKACRFRKVTAQLHATFLNYRMLLTEWAKEFDIPEYQIYNRLMLKDATTVEYLLFGDDKELYKRVHDHVVALMGRYATTLEATEIHRLTDEKLRFAIQANYYRGSDITTNKAKMKIKIKWNGKDQDISEWEAETKVSFGTMLGTYNRCVTTDPATILHIELAKTKHGVIYDGYNYKKS